MKNKLIIFFIFISVIASAKEQSMTPNKDNYFIYGDDIKFQMSMKYNLIYPFETGIYFAFTELAFWEIQEKSSPFKEFNHNPEVFYKSQKYGILDYIQISPYEHKSNGKDGDLSRGIDRYYGQIQLSYGDNLNIGTNVKGWNYYHIAKKNADITDYSGYFEAEFFIRILSRTVDDFEKEKIYVKGGCGNDYKKGWIETGLMTRIFTSKIQPRLFLNYFYGYGESLVDYNVKEKQFRAGVIF